MDTAVIDFPAIAIGVAVALVISVALARADRGENHRRSWIVAGVLATVLTVLGLVDLLRETPRQTHIATVLIGVPLPILAAMVMVRATRRVRPLFRWPAVFATTFIFLFGGLLLGAAMLPRYLP